MKAFNFEIYTKHPQTGEEGWEIEQPTIFAETKEKAKQFLKESYPNFDCIILFNYGIEITDGSVEAKHYANGEMYFLPTSQEQYK